jgi:hypothetical protein
MKSLVELVDFFVKRDFFAFFAELLKRQLVFGVELIFLTRIVLAFANFAK